MGNLENKYVVVREVYGKGKNQIVKVTEDKEEALGFFDGIVAKFDKQCKDKFGTGCLTLHHLSDNIVVLSPEDMLEKGHSYVYSLQCNSYECVDNEGNRVFIPIEDNTILKLERMNKVDMDKI